MIIFIFFLVDKWNKNSKEVIQCLFLRTIKEINYVIGLPALAYYPLKKLGKIYKNAQATRIEVDPCLALSRIDNP